MRKLCLWALTAAATLAQNAPDPNLSLLEQTSRQKTADWERLAQGLNASIRGLLPCDPRGPAAIIQVSVASEARLAALADYLQASAQQASRNTEAAKQALASSAGLASVFNEEKTDTGLEEAGADGQLVNLTQSAKNKTALDPAREALQKVRGELQQRSELIEAASKDAAALTPALRDLVAADEAREAVWKDLQAAYDAERARWKAYYAARLARAQTECSIIGGPSPAPAAAPGSATTPRPASKGKQP